MKTRGACLLTVGAPLTRKVEPDRRVLEAGPSVVVAGDTYGVIMAGAGMTDTCPGLLTATAAAAVLAHTW